MNMNCNKNSGGDLMKKAKDRVKPKRPIKFEASDAFYQRLHEEKLRRGETIQQMAIRGLMLYFAIPIPVQAKVMELSDRTHRDYADVIDYLLRDFFYSIDPKANLDDGLEHQEILVRTALEAGRSREIDVLIDTLSDYMRSFPSEKLRLLKESLALDLKYYRSARITEEKERKS
jgi:hypothetical protein